MDISAVNNLSFEDYFNVFGNVVEKSPFIAAALWSRRPFNSLNDMHVAIDHFIDDLTESGKVGLLRCYSELAGRDLQGGTLSRESQEEQAQAGLYTLQSWEASHITQLNTKYWEKFGFPFIICARMNDKDRILQQLSECCRNEYVVEFLRAIEEVKKICHLRVQALVLTD
ncbi:2-oxo-4-hydroxy-4-carboxy-5-ureidoimidazoline decarboxylase-like [Cynoglossus semilaevis]|uniref:2-oxo-4-hydroxy-4-carboxy-5-ureidoimidazoline decarboxylase n=1 Tax=Cynoglossus semilaevis TaxID=244447 RepID=A0A3P8WJU0_CYNSE|nr:2-oxo-4-hydroxy-4-carboxy-5-ureidoimidazoline decarboxylase-like [Cynoglossus semilaevis]